MVFSKVELQIILEMARQNNHITGLALQLKKSKSQVLRTMNALVRKNVIQRINRQYSVQSQPHTALLMQLLLKHPQLVEVIPDSSIPVLISCLEPKTIKQIAKETNLKEVSVYKIIERCRKYSILRKTKTMYLTNDKMWLDLRKFLEAYKQYTETVDYRIPSYAIIYYKTSDEIIFSTPDIRDATLTGFSAYKDYGIRLLSPINEYYLPKKKLTKKEVFLHSIYIARKEPTINNLIYIALFYAKHKKDLKQFIDDPMITNIIKVLNEKNIDNYPSKQEIIDRAEVYGILIR